MRIILASASPARLATLRAAGVHPEVRVSDVDEQRLIDDSAGAAPAQLVALLAGAKLDAVLAQLPSEKSDDAAGPTVVIACDSMLEIDGQALGKPDSAQEAIARWQRMRGRTGVLLTGHAIALLGTREAAAGHSVRSATSATVVRFAPISDAEIAAYVATREPLHVAGAFTLDGLGGWFIEGIEGDHHGVVGISLPLVRTMIHELGLTIPMLWATEHGSARQRGDGAAARRWGGGATGH